MSTRSVPISARRGIRARARSAAVVVLIISLLGTACNTSATTEDVGTLAVGLPTVVPEATAEPEPTSTPLPTAVPRPTSTPLPTVDPIPTPTPEFGPTGRPTDAGEVFVLTTRPEVYSPETFDGPDGDPLQLTYTYLSGSVINFPFLTNPTYFGNTLALQVATGEPGDEWAEVHIATRPATTAWVRTEQFTWSASNHYVQVNVGNNTVTVWDGDEIIVDSVSVVTGTSNTPTPIATAYVDEIMNGPSGAYGPKLLSLSIFSESLNTFGSAGGIPKVALHGTNQPELLGSYGSNGCIRLPNDVISMMAEVVPVGTRVDLVAG